MSGGASSEARRLIRQLNSKIQVEEFYDAHQLVRALFERFAKKSDLNGAIEFAEQYAKIFAEHEQHELCINLGQRVLALMKKIGEKPTPSNVENLTMLFLLCPANSTESKFDFMNDVILWVQKEGDAGLVSDLQSLIADAYLDENKFGACQNHLVFCDDVDRLVNLTVRWETAGYPSEKYFYALRLLLILLHRGKVDLAGRYLEKYAEKSQINLDTANCHPAIQTAYLIWASCKYNCLELYELIGRKYVLILRMDDCVARIYKSLQYSVFKLRPPENPLMGMLSQMMGGNTPSIM